MQMECYQKYKLASAISQSHEAYACIAFHAVVVDFLVFYIESKEEITNTCL